MLGSAHRQNIPSDGDLEAKYRLQCGYLNSFHEGFQGHIFISVRPKVKLDMLKAFDLEKSFDIHLYPPTSTHPPPIHHPTGLLNQVGNQYLLPIFTSPTWNQKSGFPLPLL